MFSHINNMLSRMAVSIKKSSAFNHFKFYFTFRSILNVIIPTKLRFRLSAVFKQNKNRRHFPRGIQGGINKITKTIRLTVIICLGKKRIGRKRYRISRTMDLRHFLHVPSKVRNLLSVSAIVSKSRRQ
jgi:hypothetical protein